MVETSVSWPERVAHKRCLSGWLIAWGNRSHCGVLTISQASGCSLTATWLGYGLVTCVLCALTEPLSQQAWISISFSANSAVIHHTFYNFITFNTFVSKKVETVITENSCFFKTGVSVNTRSSHMHGSFILLVETENLYLTSHLRKRFINSKWHLHSHSPIGGKAGTSTPCATISLLWFQKYTPHRAANRFRSWSSSFTHHC